MSSALNLVSSDTRRELLQLIKRQGSVSVDEAMDALEMARTTVRDHLLQLMEKGLLDRTAVREGRGRPSHRYTMSRRAAMLFPSRDGELMGRLVQFLYDNGAEDLVETFFEDYWEARTHAVKRRLQEVDSDDRDRQLEVLQSILEDEGFMPDVSRDENRVTIRECNCPFPETVKKTKIPCRLERAFFEAVLETELARVSYIPEGNPACTYEIDEEEVSGA